MILDVLTGCSSYLQAPQSLYQFEQMTAEADESGNDLRNSKNEIAELNRMIIRLQNELEAAKGQVRCRLT